MGHTEHRARKGGVIMDTKKAASADGQNNQQINLTEAAHFLQVLDPEEGMFTFQTFRDSGGGPSLTQIFHDTFEECKAELERLNEDGAGVFVTVCKTDGSGRKKENIVAVRAVFLDLDGEPLPESWPIEPHFIIETSLGRWHCYWLLEGGVPLDRFTETQKAIARMFNGDPVVCDLSRVMRIPGFIHQKKKPFLSHIILDRSQEPRYTSHQILEAFPSVEISPKNKIAAPVIPMMEDPILQALTEKIMVIRQDRSEKGKFVMTCPWAGEHTNGDPEAAYWSPNHGGYAGPGFKCLHSHCVNRSIKDLKEYLGITSPVLISEKDHLRLSDSFRNLYRTINNEIGLIRWRGDFYLWTGTRWEMLEDKELQARMHRWLDKNICDSKGHPIRASRGLLENIWSTFERVCHTQTGLDAPFRLADPPEAIARGGLLILQDGLLETATRKVLPPCVEVFSPNFLPYSYDPDATCPQWMQFMGELWPDDRGEVRLLQQWFGYVISGRTDLHKMLFLVGSLRGGKGTIARILTALAGKGNTESMTFASLGSNFGLSGLIGKSLAVFPDARMRGGMHEGAIIERLLSISGEDSLPIDRKYRSVLTVRLGARIVLVSNEIPRFTDSSGALASRFLILKFTRSFLGQEDTSLEDRLLKEIPGILNWALSGLDDLRDSGRFVTPDSSGEMGNEMNRLASPVAAFVQDCCVAGSHCHVEKAVLFEAWKQWSEENGHHPGSKEMFSRNLQAAVQVQTCRPGEDPGRTRHWSGIELIGPRRASPSTVRPASVHRETVKKTLYVQDGPPCPPYSQNYLLGKKYGDGDTESINRIGETVGKNGGHGGRTMPCLGSSVDRTVGMVEQNGSGSSPSPFRLRLREAAARQRAAKEATPFRVPEGIIHEGEELSSPPISDGDFRPGETRIQAFIRTLKASRNVTAPPENPEELSEMDQDILAQADLLPFEPERIPGWDPQPLRNKIRKALEERGWAPRLAAPTATVSVEPPGGLKPSVFDYRGRTFKEVMRCIEENDRDNVYDRNPVGPPPPHRFPCGGTELTSF